MTHPTTAALLATEATLAQHGQAHPTDTRELRRLRAEHARAVAAWLREGAPDLPEGADRPAPPPVPQPERRDEGEDDRDWSPVEVTAEVRAATDKAVLLYDGQHKGWVPRSLLWGEGDEDIEDVEAAKPEVGDVGIWTMPVWLARERGWV